MLKIEFDQEKMDKCLCDNCPVQSKSSCIKDQNMIMEETGRNMDIDSGFILDPEKVPKVYCATGKTSCDDLDFHEECQCFKCDVWIEYDLEARGAPGYFCKNGKATECCEIELDEKQIQKSKLREIRRTYYTPK
jgi:hypothetical protein